VSEWLKELAWKASIWVTVSRVRIPSSLQRKAKTKVLAFLLVKGDGMYFQEHLTNKKDRAMEKPLGFSL
jgi:hypothetical protein